MEAAQPVGQQPGARVALAHAARAAIHVVRIGVPAVLHALVGRQDANRVVVCMEEAVNALWSRQKKEEEKRKMTKR